MVKCAFLKYIQEILFQINKHFTKGSQNVFLRMVSGGDKSIRSIYCKKVSDEIHNYVGFVNSPDLNDVLDISKTITTSFINPL